MLIKVGGERQKLTNTNIDRAKDAAADVDGILSFCFDLTSRGRTVVYKIDEIWENIVLKMHKLKTVILQKQFNSGVIIQTQNMKLN